MSGPSANPPASDPPFPPLGISDLLVLTLTTAFGMAWTGGLREGGPQLAFTNWADTAWGAALDAFNGLLVGVELFGFAVLMREITRRGRSLRSLAPGHWWFIVAGPQHVLEGMQYLVAIFGLSQFDYIGQWRTVESAANVPLYLIFVAAWLWAAAHIKTRLWRRVFVLKALEQLVWVVLYAYRSARNAGIWVFRIDSMHLFGVAGTLFICLLAALLFAVASDLRSRVKRDWLHYVGVAVIVAEAFNFFHAYGRLAVRWWSAVWIRLIP